jgi:hypothetical protein
MFPQAFRRPILFHGAAACEPGAGYFCAPARTVSNESSDLEDLEK